MDYTQYYTADRLKRIKEARNYLELREVALEVLQDLNRDHYPKPIVQVCGPITNGGRNTRAENLWVFKRVIERVCADGLVVFNQTPFEDDMDRIHRSYPELRNEVLLLEEFYGSLFATGLIQLLCFFPGWESSWGAVWEKQRGQELSIPILYLSDCYLIDP